ncbi:magnesium transporter MRS2-5 isoform X1 [Ziziphus jujuba]|nr:magnesium transporter MRS2-5 isoform X1 [Ziziphus jujuba]XP_024934244.1 magnesium transporter MRS2-5 isoform X1 [Ziziphus jujuba]XP_024934245.1 magnesium transporter MRS2-5 isoform X1 [Ziziphus jujuba]XP_024934246.1 magnesium transporter MRS2-5 isoform X1 [Ziziphus jujuba]XP_048318508.1 magnesium transporter MRS2-5 isoform X1 [Ziziphus jujuba]XP_048318509.1 magnesium transporter MRS2-5 isoform X1 [Ziziphus jujuba]XP_048318511.1 magnesium transporter MRS2-5 [Ziziphus jujuba var. spinosa]XP
MEESQTPFLPSDISESIPSHNAGRLHLDGHGFRGLPFIQGFKKRGHGSRSWIKIDENGNSKVLELDKAAIMRHCSLPARDLRLLDPLFIYPSTILGRDKAIVVSLEQIRCIITAQEVILMNSLDGCVVEYESELCKRLQSSKDQSDDLPFEFRALELALELTCMSLDAQVTELEMEIYPLLDELASSINTLNLERARRLKGHLLALTQRVQKVRDELEHLMDDDGDMAEMHLTEKKQRSEGYPLNDLCFQSNTSGEAKVHSISAPVSPVGSVSGVQKLQRAFSTIVSSSKHASVISSSNSGENIAQLEMLLEAYFVVIDNSFSKLLSLKEYIDDTEDLINIKLGNVQNHLIQFELLLTAATFVATIFAAVTGVFGTNFTATIFDYPSAFTWVLLITGIFCCLLYSSFLFYFRHKKLFPL